MLELWRRELVPLVKVQAGFQSAYVLRQPETNKGLSITLWESEAEMRATEESGVVKDALAKFVGKFAGAPVQERYEVLLEVRGRSGTQSAAATGRPRRRPGVSAGGRAPSPCRRDGAAACGYSRRPTEPKTRAP